MFDNFLPIPDAESLPFYPSVLNLVACVCDALHVVKWLAFAIFVH